MKMCGIHVHAKSRKSRGSRVTSARSQHARESPPPLIASAAAVAAACSPISRRSSCARRRAGGGDDDSNDRASRDIVALVPRDSIGRDSRWTGGDGHTIGAFQRNGNETKWGTTPQRTQWSAAQEEQDQDQDQAQAQAQGQPQAQGQAQGQAQEHTLLTRLKVDELIAELPRLARRENGRCVILAFCFFLFWRGAPHCCSARSLFQCSAQS